MTRFVAAALVVAVSCGVVARADAPPAGYKLVWSEEFDGPQVDTSRWLYRETIRKDMSICLPRNVSLEDGKLRIDLKKEPHQGLPLTCGGLITKRTFKYGYFEVSARMDGGPGWHESFWTTATTNFDLTDEQRTRPRIEIDPFEHYASHDAHQFSYGIIEWHPVQGGVSRDVHKTPIDLADTYNTYAFEFTPDFINFFFNGELLKTVPIGEVAHNRFHIWLSAIGTKLADDMQDGVCHFEYLRCYEMDFQTEEYETRRRKFRRSTTLQVEPPTSGRLWIEAEDFVRPGVWSPGRDGQARVLRGTSDRDKQVGLDRRIAQTVLVAPPAGKYRVWVRGRDYADNSPGSRYFHVAVNGRQLEPRFGTHREQGFAWQDGGVVTLDARPLTIELVDSSRFFARCDKLLLSRDLEFRPEGDGRASNVEHRTQTAGLRSIVP